MAKKIEAYEDNKGNIYKTEKEADLNNDLDNLLKNLNDFDFVKNVDRTDLGKYNLEQLKLIGRIAENILKD